MAIIPSEYGAAGSVCFSYDDGIYDGSFVLGRRFSVFFYSSSHYRSAMPLSIFYVFVLAWQVYLHAGIMLALRWALCSGFVGVVLYQFTYALALGYNEAVKLSVIDELTQLLNRRALNRRLKEWHSYKQRHPDVLISLVILDLDHFKLINDEFGHLVGDEVLFLLAETLRERLRDTDISARFGGEEFALLLPNTSLIDAECLVDELRALLATKSFVQGQKVTFSAGISLLNSADTIDEWLIRCDNALYRAKRAGRNCSRLA